MMPNLSSLTTPVVVITSISGATSEDEDHNHDDFRFPVLLIGAMWLIFFFNALCLQV